MLKFAFSVTFFVGLNIITQAQVKINEVMVNPQNNSTAADIQSLKVCTQPTFGREYIELYNPNPCEATDISCFLIGYDNGFTGGLHGTFRFPPGSTIPPLGFLSIGGPNSGATINLHTFCGTPFLQTAADRWYLPNGDGYLILWNENGTPVDAVYWTTGTGQPNKWGTDSDIQNPPTQIANAPACPNAAALPGPSSIPVGSSFVHYAGVSPNMGLVIHRTTDGAATWATNAAPSLNACNGICTENTSFSINATVTQPSCGQSNGAITLAPSPAGIYSYNWSHDAANSSNTANNLADGSYTVTIELNGCTRDTTINLINSTALNPTLTTTDPTCTGNDGTIIISGLPPGNYTYTWTPAVSTSNTANNLSDGNYSILISDDNGCTHTANVTLNPATDCDCTDPLVLSASPTPNTNCNGSSTPCEYTGPSIVINEVMVNPQNNSTAADIQSLKVCTQPTFGREYIELYNPNPCEATDISCFLIGYDNGFTGGLHGTFRFPPGTTIPPLGFLSIGGPNSGATINLQTFCGTPFLQTAADRWYLPNGDGYLILWNENGTPVDAVYWTTGAGQPNKWGTDSDIQNPPTQIANAPVCPNVAALPGPSSIPAGSSFVHYAGVSPNMGLVIHRTTDGAATWATNATPNLNACNGACAPPFSGGGSTCTGTATVQINSGAAGPYTYLWNDPEQQTTATATGLCAGTYCVTVTDASDECTETICIEVVDELNLQVYADVTDPSCLNNDGSIVLTTNSAIAVTYTWTPSVSTTNSAADLPEGSYQITVNQGSCQWDTNIVLTAPELFTLSATVQQSSCNSSDGEIVLSPNPVGNYQYTWTPNISASNTASNLPSGTYSVNILSEDGCEKDTTIVLNTTDGPNGAIVNVINPTCNLSNGSVTITNVTGGSAPYQYNFNNIGNSTETIYNNLNQGMYTLIITDVNGCEYVHSDITLTVITPPSDIISTISHTTCGQNNAVVSIQSVTDGTSPFVYSLNNGPFTNSTFYNNLSEGTYSITVQDANNCEFSVSVSVDASEGITGATISSIDSTCDDNNGTISVENVIGGLSPYTYQLDDGAPQTNPIFNNLAAGSYFINISDVTGCSYTTNAIINGGITPTADFTVTPETADIVNGIFTAINQSSSDVVTFEWYTPFGTPQTGSDAVFQTTINTTETGAQPITLIVTNEFGCLDSITKFVFLTNQVLFYAPNSFTPDGDKFNEEWKVYIENFDINSFELLIFNRWGEVVFESRNAQVGWNGTYNNLLCPDGVYIWHVTFSEFDTDNKLNYKGHINLIR